MATEFKVDLIADSAKSKIELANKQGSSLGPAAAIGKVFIEISRERLQSLFATNGKGNIPMPIEDHMRFFSRNRLLGDFTQSWGIGFAGVLMPIINTGPFDGFSSEKIAQEYNRFVLGLPLPNIDSKEFFKRSRDEIRTACSEKVATASLQQLMVSIPPESLLTGTTKLGWFFIDVNHFRRLLPAYHLLVFCGGSEHLIDYIISPGQTFDKTLAKIQPAPRQRRLDELAGVDRLLERLDSLT